VGYEKEELELPMNELHAEPGTSLKKPWRHDTHA
jgi:hypothetical protein